MFDEVTLLYASAWFAVMAVYFLIFLFGLIIFHVWVRYGRIGRIVNKIPGAYPLPIFGNIFLLAGEPEQMWNHLRSIAKDHRITRIWFLSRAWVVVRDPDDIKILLASKVNLNKRAMYDLTLPWLQNGLLTSDRDIWTHRRKIVKIGLYFNIMRKYVQCANEHAERLVEQIKLHGDEPVLSLIPLLFDLTLRIVCESALDVSLDKLDEEYVKQYKQAIHDMFDIIMYRGTRPYITNWMMNFLPLGRKQARVVKILHGFTNSIIQERRKYHANRKADDASDEDRGKSMLDVLLSAEREGLMNAEAVREEVDIFTLAAHETTGATISYMLMLFAENLEVQDRARAEIIRIFSENEGKLNIPEIQKFEYLDRCIKETMRLYPTISQFLRYMDEDVQLKKYLIPRGVDVLFLIYDLHRDPKYWPEPEKFDPDRFLPENVKNRHPFAYIPFSAGFRNCIGQKFAMFEMKVILAHILYNFYIEPIDRTTDMKLKLQIVLQPSHPIHVKFVKRNVSTDV